MADFSKLSDDELLAATREQPEAFGAFYERHAAGVLAVLVRLTGDRDVALDLTAEVFAAALAAVPRYRPGEAPARAWLLGIARRKLAELRRRRGRADAARRRLGMPRLTFGEEDLQRVEEVLDAQRTGYLDGMASLPDDERQAVAARVIGEMGYGELAVAAGTSEVAIRKRVSRGLARLAQLGQRS